MEEISGDLMSHLRYPEDLFKVQRELLSRYHVTDAASFYSGGNFWNIPNDPTAGSANAPQPPYYLTMQMPEQESGCGTLALPAVGSLDRKSTRLNSSHVGNSYAVCCLKKKIKT